jgi:iron complex transport system substrate-binding protein
LETVYEVVLAKDLERRGSGVERPRKVSFEFEGMVFVDAFRIDILVEGLVAVELKSVEQIAPVHCKQLLTHLRLMNLSVGLLINFGGATLKVGVKRIVNNHSISPSATPRLRVNQKESFRREAEE